MSKTSDALTVSAPGPMTIGGRTFLVRGPAKADLLTIRTWIRKNYARILGRPPGLGFTSEDLAGLSAEDRKLFIAEAARTAKRQRDEISPDEALDVTTCPEGAAFMIWVAARRYDPTITFEWLKKEITAENVEQVLADFDTACGVEDKEGQPDPKAPGADSSSPT